jgi:hypothetical protein
VGLLLRTKCARGEKMMLESETRNIQNWKYWR